MKKIFSTILAMTMTVSMIPSTFAESETDYTDTLTYSEYGGSGIWWDHSDAEITTNDDGSIKIKNIDNNSSYSAVDVANAALGGEYAEYTAEDYANLSNSGTDVQSLVRAALTDDKRTLGSTNHGLLSNKITVDTQSTKIRFTAKFEENGAFVEISNSSYYGPYINTENGTITVNTGYENQTLLENFNADEWYTFELILHDGRKLNPVSSGDIILYGEDGTEVGKLENVQLHYTDVEWYKVNFFPNSRNGAEMELKDFSIQSYDGVTPSVTVKPTMTPYPTLEPTSSPSPTPEGYATPKPTLNPQPANGAASKNVYTFHDDFESYIKNVGSSIESSDLTAFSTTANIACDEYNNKFVTLTNTASGTRYFATVDSTTSLITSTAVSQVKVKFNTLKANDNGMVAMIDLTSSSADNQKSDDSKLVIAERINVDCSGQVTVGDDVLGTVTTGKWYTIKSVSNVSEKKNDIYIYDENGLVGEVTNSSFYNADATGIKNYRFNIRRGSGSYSIDDIYMYELKDNSETVFEDVSEFDAPLINYFATLVQSESNGIKITAAYDADGKLTDITFNDEKTVSSDGGTVKTFNWNSINEMKPINGKKFLGNETVTADEVNKMINTITGSEIAIIGDVSRENLYTSLVEIYKECSGDSEPTTADLNFDDNSSITNQLAIGIALKLGLTPVTSGKFEPDKMVTRFEAVQAVSRLITAINIGITDKIVPEPEEEIFVPHVIDQFPETGVMRDPMVLNAPDGYYYMCCSTGTSPENAKGDAFPREDTSDEDLWKDDTGVRVWRSTDLIDWEAVKSAKEDTEYPYYIWNMYEGGTWEKVNEFGVNNINEGEKRFGQVLWAPEIHWVKGTYFIVYCMNPGGTSIARSVSGKPEGPYVRQECSQDTLFKARIDASMFWDDDNEVYYTDGSCAIWHMNDDMTAIAKRSDGVTEDYISAQAPGKEGGFLFKHNGLYYATAGEFDTQGGYDSVVGINKTGKCLTKGAYQDVHWLYTLGHNGYFEDKDGNWWATMFGNDHDILANATNGFNNGFALVPIDFDKYTGKIIIDKERLTAWTDLLQENGYKFNK